MLQLFKKAFKHKSSLAKCSFVLLFEIVSSVKWMLLDWISVGFPWIQLQVQFD